MLHIIGTEIPRNAIVRALFEKSNCIQHRYFDIYNWTSDKNVPSDILNMCRFCFGLPGNDYTEDEKTAEEVGRRRRLTDRKLRSAGPAKVQLQRANLQFQR